MVVAGPSPDRAVRRPSIQTHPEVDRVLGALQTGLLQRWAEAQGPGSSARVPRERDPLAEAWRAAQEAARPARTWLGQLVRWPGRARRQREALAAAVDALLALEERVDALADRVTEEIGAPLARLRGDLAALENGTRQEAAALEHRLAGRIDEILAAATDPLSGAAARSRARQAAALARLLPRTHFDADVRGSEDGLRGRLGAYAHYFTAAPGPVLDAGCGRGAFLDVLARAGIAALGIDLAPDAIAACRARGHRVAEADVLEWLASCDAGSLGGVFAVQLVEHLTPTELTAFVEASARALAPGGRILIETLHPESWLSLARWFWRDPGHVRLVHPDTLAVLLGAAGFTAVEVHVNPAGDDVPAARLGRASELAGDHSPILATAELRDALFPGTDYFAVATR